MISKEADTMAMPQKISRGTLISQGKERAFFSKLNENRLTRDLHKLYMSF